MIVLIATWQMPSADATALRGESLKETRSSESSERTSLQDSRGKKPKTKRALQSHIHVRNR